MNFIEAVNNIGTIPELKRVAGAYVIDYRNLSNEEIKTSLLKVAPQYYHRESLAKAIHELFFCENRDHRVISRLLLKNVLLQKDDFMCLRKETEDEIISLEQSIIDQSNEELFKRSGERGNALDLFQFILETAWEDGTISKDERTLIAKLKKRLKITDTEHQIIEAILGKYPSDGNRVHSRGDIEETRKLLQSAGVIFSVRDKDNVYDLIPEEIAKELREIFNIEIRQHGYKELLSSKYVRSKKYYLDILGKCEIPAEYSDSMETLQKVFIEQVPASTLLGGIAPRDGLESPVLKKWCGDLGISAYGTKIELIERIIKYYDSILLKEETDGDERESLYKFFTKLASRDLDYLRKQQIISKDIECERKFEEATDYLFEKKLLHKPLKMSGNNHADGTLSHHDKVIYWDNKSKESPVNLKDHIKQFDSYVRASDKKVACFLVIAPSYTPESSAVAMQYQVENGTIISLITAGELKDIADKWCALNSDKPGGHFPLGYLIQPGRLNKDLMAGLF